MKKFVLLSFVVSSAFASFFVAAADDVAPQTKRGPVGEKSVSPGDAKDTKKTNPFNQADLDKNGALSREELKKSAPGLEVIRNNFDVLDKNKDGEVAREELKAFNASRIKAIEEAFVKADTGKSGGLSKAEVMKAKASLPPVLAKRFDIIDADKNKDVTFAEFQEYVKNKNNK